MTDYIWFIQAISNPLRHRGYVAGDLNGPDCEALSAPNCRLPHLVSFGVSIEVKGSARMESVFKG